MQLAGHDPGYLGVLLPLNYLELVKALKKAQHLRVRGVIVDISPFFVMLNYADFEIVAPNGKG